MKKIILACLVAATGLVAVPEADARGGILGFGLVGRNAIERRSERQFLRQRNAINRENFRRQLAFERLQRQRFNRSSFVDVGVRGRRGLVDVGVGRNFVDVDVRGFSAPVFREQVFVEQFVVPQIQTELIIDFVPQIQTIQRFGCF